MSRDGALQRDGLNDDGARRCCRGAELVGDDVIDGAR